MDQPSSWALAPERGLDTMTKEEISEWDGLYNEIPTFAPELLSSPEVRQRARSSGYGAAVPVVNRVVLEKDELRPWEEKPTFTPELVKSKLRESARSSSYGKVTAPARKLKDPETPKFTPEVERPKSAQKLYSQAKSSSYGKVTAPPRRPVTAPEPAFKPELSSNAKRRGSAKSSGYGKVIPVTSRTGSPTKRDGFDTSPAKPKYTPRYTLLTDKSHEDTLKIKKVEKEADFVLDGEHVTYNRTHHHDAFPQVEKFTETAAQLKLRTKAASSQYGVASPAVGPRPSHTRADPLNLKFDVASSSLSEPYEPFTARNKLTDKARSSSYGVASPPQGTKPQPKPTDPKWNVDVKKSDIPVEPPAFRRPSTGRAKSHGYGKVAPPRGEKYYVESKPLWIPTNNKSVSTANPPPVPRSTLNDHVRSHYGRDYDPVSLYAFNGDEEFDDEDMSSAPAPYDDMRNGEVELNGDEAEEYEEEGEEVVEDEVY